MKLRCLAILSILSFLLWAGCATKGREKWLNVFFDGVPPDEMEADEGAIAFIVLDTVPVGSTEFPKDVSVFISSDDSNSPVPTANAKVEPYLWLHGPYASRNCQGCHNSAFSNSLRAGRREICFQCHVDFIQGLAFTHGPAGAGECLACHTPHYSKQKYGLIRLGQDLCLKCHQRSDIERNSAHETIGDDACQSCHDPHQSETKFLLRITGADDVSKGG